MNDPNPYAPPRHDEAAPVTRSLEGVELALPAQTRFGKRCVKCGARDGIEFFDKRVTYIPDLAYASFLICGVVAFAIILATRKVRALRLPLCPSCALRWQHAHATDGLLQAVAIMLFFVATFLFAVKQVETSLAGLAMLVLAALTAVYARRLEERRTLRITAIHHTGIVLRYVHPEAARKLRRD